MSGLIHLEQFYFGPQCVNSFLRRILEISEQYNGDIYLGLDIDQESQIPYLVVYKKAKNHVTVGTDSDGSGQTFGSNIISK